MIRIDAIWLATEPVDMRAGADTLLARMVMVFGAARPAPCLSVCQPTCDANEGAGLRRPGNLAGHAAPESRAVYMEQRRAVRCIAAESVIVTGTGHRAAVADEHGE